MDVAARHGLGVHRLELRETPPLVGEAVHGDVDVVVHVVVEDAADREDQPVPVGVPQRELVAGRQRQVLRQLDADQRLAGYGVGLRHVPVVEVQKALQRTLTGCYDPGVLPGLVGLYGHTALKDQLQLPDVIPAVGAEIVQFLRCQAAAEGHVVLEECDLAVLELHRVPDRIPQPVAGQQQRRTAADTEDHHQEALAVTEQVAQRRLLQEAQALPEEVHALQQHPLPGLRRPGTQQIRRGVPQLPAAGEIRRQRGDGQIDQRHGGAEAEVQQQMELAEFVHHLVRLPDDRRQHVRTGEKARGAADQGRADGVRQVFADDPPAGKAEGPQHADLGALFVHHPRHGGDADQRRHEEEEQREHPRDALDDVAVALKADVAHIGLAAEEPDLRRADGVQRLQRVGSVARRLRRQFRPALLRIAVGKLADPPLADPQDAVVGLGIRLRRRVQREIQLRVPVDREALGGDVKETVDAAVPECGVAPLIVDV